MDKYSASLVLIQKGNKFNLMQCPKNDLEWKQMEDNVCLKLYEAKY